MTYPETVTVAGIECRRVETLPRGASWQSRDPDVVIAALYYAGLAGLPTLSWTVTLTAIEERPWGREPRLIASGYGATLEAAETALLAAALVEVVAAATARAA